MGGAGLDTKQVNIPFDFNADVAGINKNSNLEYMIEIPMQDFMVLPDESIDGKIDLDFYINTDMGEDINVIDEIDLEETRQKDHYSMVIYFVKPGDTLWNIAKTFKSTVEDIVRVNEIEDENKLSVGQQLYIPKYVTRREMPA